MTATDIANKALAQIGARAIITDITTDTTPPGVYARMFYNDTRQRLLRAAPWGFARKTIVLDQLGLLSDDPPASIYPWFVKYGWPSDCLKFRYLIPPPTPPAAEGGITPPTVGTVYPLPWIGPNRQFRFLVSHDPDPAMGDPSKVILSNIQEAYGVYTYDCEDTTLFDVQFEDALIAALAYELIIPLSGNVAMKADFYRLAKEAVDAARATDGNEAIPSTDHTVDWIASRGVYNYPGAAALGGLGIVDGMGSWYEGYDLNWGM